MKDHKGSDINTMLIIKCVPGYKKEHLCFNITVSEAMINLFSN